MNLTAKLQGDLLVVAAETNRIDSAGAIEFKEAMREMTRQASARVVLDLSQVRFLDSSGLGAVVAVMKMLAPERRLELSGLTPTVAKVFRLTRLDSVFTIHPSLPDSLANAG
jgi:anti-sigma B factor antagonist